MIQPILWFAILQKAIILFQYQCESFEQSKGSMLTYIYLKSWLVITPGKVSFFSLASLSIISLSIDS